MKKSSSFLIMLVGAVIAALSFLFGMMENETAKNAQPIILTVGVVIIFLGAVLLLISCRKPTKQKLLPDGAEYRRKQSIMTAPEKRLYALLTRILNRSRCLILPQTALVSVVDKVSGGGFRNELFRVADFCVVDAESFEPLIVIELNDASHQREDRKLRDDKVAAICADAGLPLLCLGLQESQDEGYVRGELRKKLRQ